MHLCGLNKLLSQVRDVLEEDRLVAKRDVIEQDEMLVEFAHVADMLHQ
jgi:hypothetical protein